MVNKSKKNQEISDRAAAEDDKIKKPKQRERMPSNQRPAKRLKRQKDISEIQMLQLYNPPLKHRNDTNGLRVPPPVVRVLRSGVKGRWCGKTVHWVMNKDFTESLNQEEGDKGLESLIAAGLIRVNGVPLQASDTVLRNMDTIERIVHWHEPPISVPNKILFTKHTLPESILFSNDDEASDGPPLLYCIDKPSSVPIYPAGPYYANSLLLMVEAQEGLPPKTLIPLHRIDRATSGLLLCANMSSVARVIQERMTSDSKQYEKNSPVRKLYLARVKGKFPAMSCETPSIPEECASIASLAWCGDESSALEVNAPIAVQLESSKSNQKKIHQCEE